MPREKLKWEIPARTQSTDAGHRGGAARSRDEGAVMGLDRRGCGVQCGRRPTGDGRSRMTTAKPFDIPKREVWEAFKKVKANQGAAGVDGQIDCGVRGGSRGNLYKLWNRLSSGSYFPPPVRRVDIPKATGGTRPLGIPTVADRVAQEVVRRYLEPSAGTGVPCRTRTAIDPAARRSMPCARRVSGAGGTTGCSTSTSRRSSTVRLRRSCSGRFGDIPTCLGCCSMWSAG